MAYGSRAVKSLTRFVLPGISIMFFSVLPASSREHEGTAKDPAPFPHRTDRRITLPVGGTVTRFAQGGFEVRRAASALQVHFLGANRVEPAVGVSTSATADGSRRCVRYRNLWEGISLLYEPLPGGEVRSTYVIAPGADPGSILLGYGAPVALDAAGSLRASLDGGEVRESAPVAWQESLGGRAPVAVAFRVVNDFQVGFSVGEYDPGLPLIIDPDLQWHTYLGPAEKLVAANSAIAVDNAGDVIVAGNGFKAWGTPLHGYAGGDWDVFLARLDTDGSLLWNTFMGSSGSDRIGGVTTDSAGNIYVIGHSQYSWGNPVRPHTTDPNPFWVYTSEDYRYDVFVAKFDPQGNPLWNTFLGGYLRDYGTGITVDSSGVYVTGRYEDHTLYKWDDPTPLRPPGGDFDAFVAKLDFDGNLVWNTFLGGDNLDSGYGVETDGRGSLYVAGVSLASWGFPLHDVWPSGRNGFIAKLTTDGNVLWSTFTESSAITDLALDRAGTALFVTGQGTISWGDPIEAAGESPAFLAKVAADGSLAWSTHLIAGGWYASPEVRVDRRGAVLVAGVSPITWGEPLHAHTGDGEEDVVLAKLSKDGALQWNTFIGGTFADNIRGMVLDEEGGIYLSTRMLNSPGFASPPVRPKSPWPDEDVMVAKFFDDVEPTPSIYMKPPLGPAGTTFRQWGVNFTPGEATLHFFDPDGSEILPPVAQPVDEEGNFSLDYTSLVSKPQGEYTWYGVDSTGLVSNKVTYLITESCAGPDVAARIDAEVVAAQDPLQPIAGAAVTLWRHDATVDALVATLITDHSGKCSFTSVSCGNYILVAEKEGYRWNNSFSTTVLSSATHYARLTLSKKGIPVLLVPGMLGSTIVDMLDVELKDPPIEDCHKLRRYVYPQLTSPVPTESSLLHIWDAFGISGWNTLRRWLVVNGFEPIDVPWDWRFETDSAYPYYLLEKIDAAKQDSPTGKVHVVAHSMGGLLTRAYIQGPVYPHRNDIEAFVMVGTPNLGSSNPYYMWEGGDPKMIDDIADSGFPDSLANPYSNTLQDLWGTMGWNFIYGPWSNWRYNLIRRFIREEVKSGRQLMSTDKFLSPDGAEPVGVQSEDSVNGWLKRMNSSSTVKRMSPDGSNGTVRTALLVGREYPEGFYEGRTIGRVPVGDPDSRYTDGKPKGMQVTWGPGDGTVPLKSASYPSCPDSNDCTGSRWAELVDDSMNKTHMALVGAYAEEICDYLLGSKCVPPEVAAGHPARLRATTDSPDCGRLAVSGDRDIRFLLTDALGRRAGIEPANGEPLQEIPGTHMSFSYAAGILEVEAAPGSYQLLIFGAPNQDFRVGVHFIGAGKADSRELRGFYRGTPFRVGITVDSSAGMALETYAPEITPVLSPKVLHTSPIPGLCPVPRTVTSIDFTPPPDPSGKMSFHYYEANGASKNFRPLRLSICGIPWCGTDCSSPSTIAVTADLEDGTESFFGELVQNNDQDYDGLSDYEEAQLGTDPANPDSDGDGFTDGEENLAGADPKDPASVPPVITASALGEGTIEPSGKVVASEGGHQKFVFAPETGYHVSDLLIDGVSVGAPTSYIFDEISANHTIEVQFGINEYGITATAGTHGRVSPAGQVLVPHGGLIAFAITPEPGYRPAHIAVDGADLGMLFRHTFSEVTSSHTLAAVFAETVPNFSFERGRRTPLSWRRNRLDAIDGRTCAIRHDGRCSLALTGTDALKSMSQTVAIPGKSGDALRIAGWSKAVSPASAGGLYAIDMQVLFDDGTRSTSRLSFGKYTHAWRRKAVTFRAGKAYHAIKIMVRFEHQTGKVWFDDIRVTVLR